MAFTKEEEAEGRQIARERLAKGPVYYNPGLMHGADTPNMLHTEETLWPYCVPDKSGTANAKPDMTAKLLTDAFMEGLLSRQVSRDDIEKLVRYTIACCAWTIEDLGGDNADWHAEGLTRRMLNESS